MMTMKPFGANVGAWQYLQGTVVKEEYGDDRHTSMADYYMAEGTPPGRWAGKGITGLIGFETSQEVSPEFLSAIYGYGVQPKDPSSSLGRRFDIPTPLEQRVKNRLDKYLQETDIEHSFEELLQKVKVIEKEEKSKPERKSVAGFEFVFSPPKSVSSWWAIADPNLKNEIRLAHQQAIDSVIEMLEKDVIKSRIGEGGVAQAEVKGIIASLFDHWDSREGDPQLHTHMLVSNKVQTLDDKWRTIDSRTLFYSVATASQVYDTALMDNLSSKFGVDWTTQDVLENPRKYLEWRRKNQTKDTPANRLQFSLDSGVALGSVKWQIHDVPHELNKEYSTRSSLIFAEKEKYINEYQMKYGRMPSDDQIIRMRQNATLATRKRKLNLSLKELTSRWRKRATPIVGDTFLAADRIKNRSMKRLRKYSLWSFRADDINDRNVEQTVDFVLNSLKDLSTWRRSNAETSVLRATAHWRFKSFEDRRLVTERLTNEVLNKAIALTPKNNLHTPYIFKTADGSSGFAPKAHDLYTTVEVWDAEERLLEAGRITNSVTVDQYLVDSLISTPTGTENRILSLDQATAVTNLLTSGRQVDVLVGPAGAGKTTSLEKLKEIWENAYGEGSVKGLAPTARAAEVLAESLGITTENTAKWIHETSKNTIESDGFSYTLEPNQLLIVDEASIAGTMALDILRGQVASAGAKLLLVGDWAQLTAVDAGGAFGLLATDRKDVAELTSLHRFKEEWEAEASKLLRLGKKYALDAYIENNRIEHGLDESIIDQAVEAWKQDEAITKKDGSNQVSLLIAPTNEMVERLNDIARKWRIEQGLINTEFEAEIASGTASPGDRIVTRQNARRIRTDKDRWVKNNDEWVIEKVLKNGDIQVSAGEEAVTLPAEYAAKHVQLAYATTAHRSQGRTVDTAHCIVDSTASRETFYVSMTRGKLSNKAYVVEDEDQLLGDASALGTIKTWRDTLESVLENYGGNSSAHATAEAEKAKAISIKQLVAEYRTIVSETLTKQYLPSLENLGLINNKNVDSLFIGPIVASMRRLETLGKDPNETIQTLLKSKNLETAENPLAVIQHRLKQEVDTVKEIMFYKNRYAPLLKTFTINADNLSEDKRLVPFFRTLDLLENKTSEPIEEILRAAIEEVRPRLEAQELHKAMAATTAPTEANKQTELLQKVLYNLHNRHEIEFKDLPIPEIIENNNLIAGLIEAAPNIKDTDIQQALEDREIAIQLRAEEILDEAIKNGEPWASDLGKPILGEESQWRKRAVTVACYRDMYNIESTTAIDRIPTKDRTRIKAKKIAASMLHQNAKIVPEQNTQRVIVPKSTEEKIYKY